MNYKVALLIPATSNGRPWETVEQCYIWKVFLKSFNKTSTKTLKYTLYFGYDHDDKLFSKEESLKKLETKISSYKNIKFKPISLNVRKGHVTKMWNILFENAYNDGCDYFFQFGDDISFLTKKWDKLMIEELKKHDDLGVVGPRDTNNPRILTQSGVSRKHYDIFKYYFPPEIRNWFCDDWINLVYKPDRLYVLKKAKICNIGGKERYNVDVSAKQFLTKLVKRGQIMIQLYLSKK